MFNSDAYEFSKPDGEDLLYGDDNKLPQDRLA